MASNNFQYLQSGPPGTRQLINPPPTFNASNSHQYLQSVPPGTRPLMNSSPTFGASNSPQYLQSVPPGTWPLRNPPPAFGGSNSPQYLQSVPPGARLSMNPPPTFGASKSPQYLQCVPPGTMLLMIPPPTFGASNNSQYLQSVPPPTRPSMNPPTFGASNNPQYLQSVPPVTRPLMNPPPTFGASNSPQYLHSVPPETRPLMNLPSTFGVASKSPQYLQNVPPGTRPLMNPPRTFGASSSPQYLQSFQPGKRPLKNRRKFDNFQKSSVKHIECKPKEKDLALGCDTCDRSFSTDAEYKTHCALHVKCDYAGCNFEAHPKVVALHQKMQHVTGYADVINKLQNDEEIKKWREERKKRFPTAENILKRKAEKAEKEARGEVVETKVFGQQLHQNQPRRRQGKGTRQPRNYNSRWNETPDSEEEDNIHIKLPRFKGLNANSELTIEDSVDEAPVEIPISRDSLDVNISDQQDPKNSVDEIPVEISISRDSLDLNKISDQQDPKSIEIDDEAPAEIPILRESLDQHESSDQQDSKNKNNQATSAELLPNPNSSTSNKKRNNDSSPNTKDRSNFKKRRNDRELAPQRCSVSLLEMLFDDEIRHERNVIMQATRYIVRNNFFNIGTDKKMINDDIIDIAVQAYRCY